MKLSKTRLRILGFSDKMIDTFLPPPEIVPNPDHWKKKGVFKLWDEAEVRKVMQTTEFKVARNEYMLSLNGHAIQRVQRKIKEIQRQNNSGVSGELEDLQRQLKTLESGGRELRRNHKKLLNDLKSSKR